MVPIKVGESQIRVLLVKECTNPICSRYIVISFIILYYALLYFHRSIFLRFDLQSNVENTKKMYSR